MPKEKVEAAGMVEYPDGPGKTTKRKHPKQDEE